MAPADITCTGNLLEPAHRPDASLQMLVVLFKSVVEVLRGAVLHIRYLGTYRLEHAQTLVIEPKNGLKNSHEKQCSV